MTTQELLGRVAARYLTDQIAGDDSNGTARYLLDCLTAAQTAAVARTVLADPTISKLVEIKLPASFLEGQGLPEEVLTTKRATYFRSAECPKSVWLLANVGDDEQQSLTELIPIGSMQLMARPETWVRIASEGLPLTDSHLLWWSRALTGLVEARQISLDRYCEYVAATRAAVDEGGHPIRGALGHALPALHLPRDTNYFNALNDKTSNFTSKWRLLFTNAFRKRSCYLVKQTPSQSLLDEEQLRSTFAKVRESVPVECHGVVEEFLATPSGWHASAQQLAECEWELVRPIFDGLKREKFNLGRATLEFFDERDPSELTDNDRDYLHRLIARKTTDAEEEDEDFYRDHRLQLKDDPSLKVKWDNFIFGSPIESEDFISGIAACMQALFDQDQHGTERRLRIASDKRNPRDLRDLNRDAGMFFAFRYRGFRELLGRSVEWDVGKLFDFADLDTTWRAASKPHWNKSGSKHAVTIKFYLELTVKVSSGAEEIYTKQLIWKFNPNGISSELCHDWGRLAGHPLVRCLANRELVGGKGRFQPIDLRNVKTLLPTYDNDRGSLVAVYSKASDLKITWLENLELARIDGRVKPDDARQLAALFKAFVEQYSAAITDFISMGLWASSVLSQLTAYAALLDTVCRNAKGDRNREALLRPLLEIGAVTVEGGPVASIVAPWHPLRMTAMTKKAAHVAGLIRHLVTAEQIYFGDTRLYFDELTAELTHPYYPEIILGFRETKPELLGVSDHHLDYSLCEPPNAQHEEYVDTNDNPSGSANRIIEILKRYLALHPHEQANLSVVLYNCDSARLPHAIVSKIQEVHDDDEDLRCQVILRHRDGGKLRDLYEQIIGGGNSDADSFVASEATRDFMARLRIGIMADEAPPPDAADGPPTDVVFLQDVIARRAKIEWYPESANPLSWDEWIPPRWSRRRPAAADDLKSVVYLTCPVASQEGWRYLTAVTSFFKGDWDGNEQLRLIPARQLDFNDPSTSQIFKEIHNLGNWVVNYDELLDRRQLINQRVKIIRYKQTDTQGRNLLISSNASTALLHRMVQQRLRELTLGLSDADVAALAKRLIDDANVISGDLVLRAAKRGRNASELIGVVLSRYLIHREVGTDRNYGWYFLDDYASWLGQKEEQIADILALSPEVDAAGHRRLAVVISESKFIDYTGLRTKRVESQKQLRQTIDRIGKALFGAPGRLDRDIWLGRFSDLVLNGIHFPANSPLDLAGLRRAIREGSCEIYLRGYSHVFVSGPGDAPECSERVVVADSENSYQEIFSRAKLRELVMHYWNNSDPAETRRSHTDDAAWEAASYRLPSERIKTVVAVSNSSSESEEADEDESASPKPKSPDDTPGPIFSTMVSQSKEIVSPSEFVRPPVVAMHTDSEEDRAWLRQTENRAKGALQQFQLQSKLVSSTLTPNAALLKFQGSAQLTVDQVTRKRSEFLTTHGLELVSIRAEPGLVVLAVARPNRRVLSLAEAWAQWKPDCSNGNQELLIGVKEDDGTPLFYSPRRNAPHALIAGSTGSGKSVLMQNILLSIASTNTPNQAEILLIDPKMGVDYFAFEGLPHIKKGIIVEQPTAVDALNRLVEEMDRRYTVLRANRVNNVFDLLKKPEATERLPILWVIHDEFAEWMLTPEYKAEVEKVVGRLGVKARAAGIFLIFAAQRPDAGVMPMQLRANLGNRLVLRVDSEGTSEIALGEKGAERLLNKGHLAAKLEGEPSIQLCQVPFIDDVGLAAMITEIRGRVP